MKMRYTFPDMEEDGVVTDEKVAEIEKALRTCRDARTHQWPSGLSAEGFLTQQKPAETCTVCGTIRSVV